MSKIGIADFAQSAKNYDFGLIWRQNCLKPCQDAFSRTWCQYKSYRY